MIFNDLWSLRFCFYIFEFKSVYVFCWWVGGHILGLLKLFFRNYVSYNASEGDGDNLPTTGAAVVLVATSSSATQPALRQFSPLVGAQPRGGEAFECKLWESSRSKLLTWSRLRLRWPPQDTSLPFLHSSPYSVFCLHRRLAPCKKRRFFDWSDVQGMMSCNRWVHEEGWSEEGRIFHQRLNCLRAFKLTSFQKTVNTSRWSVRIIPIRSGWTSKIYNWPW